MFGGGKQTFGAAPQTTGFGFSNTAAASPFSAQSTFNKNGPTKFGQTPAFGQQTSLFGQTQQTGGLFGSNPVPAFGAPPQPQPQQQTGFGTFGQPQQQQQQQNTSLFGTTQQPQPGTSSLFGQASTSAFGAAKPAGFGFGQPQPSGSLFGQPSTSASAAGGAFGGFGTTATSGGLFGSTATPAFGQQGAQPGANGSAIVKYQPSLGTDTLLKNGQTNNVSTKQHCITAMKEYEAKSFEEIRIEDYVANRKGPQAGSVVPSSGGLFAPATGGGVFGAAAPQPATGLFGQPATQPTNFGFGQPQQQQPQQQSTLGAFGQQSAFGQAAAQPQQSGFFGKSFATPATSASAFGGFGTPATNTAANPFGAAKPFGQATTGGLFGQPAASGTSAFGQPAATGFGAFGQTSQPAPMFGATSTTTNTGAFGMISSAPNTGFGFGAQPNTSTAGGGLFGSKPATGFGATPAFGTPAATNTGFGAFGQANTSGSLFNSSFNKPAQPSFGGFGAQPAPTLGTGLGMGGTGTSLFGNNQQKPGGLFGTTTQPLGGGAFGSSFGQTNTLGGLGQNTMGGMGQGMMNQQQQPQQQNAVPIHQQILALTTSPYGDNPIFKDLKPSSGQNDDVLRPTNPAAQKAILESSNQFKVSPKVSNGLKVKPVGSMLTKKSLFGGLEEFDGSVEESFSLKPNAKRLIIKAKVSGSAAKSPMQQQQSPVAPLQKLNISEKNSTPIRPSTASSSKENESPAESFRNQISTQPLAQDTDNSRRVSWLHSNALEKVTKQNRLATTAEGPMNNTINDLVTAVADDGSRKTAKDVLPGINRITAADEPVRSSRYQAHISNDSLFSTTQSFLDETNADISLINTEPHPCGVTLQRSKYYTIPAMDKLVEYLAEDGSCIVPNFTIGRTGYGNVYFNEPIDVAGLNFDELVHFRHKEVIIYPDDENKPPVGTELNRKAQITLDQVWPHDKTEHQPIKSKERLDAMDYEGKLRRVCDKHDMRFIEYRPETGSWVFRVDHFSKYGLSDSDEDEVPVDPKKAKLVGVPDVLTAAGGAIPKANRKPVDTLNDTLPTSQGLGGGKYDQNTFMDDEEDFSMDFSSDQRHLANFQATSPSAAIAMSMGTDAHKLQLMKASFFVDDEFDRKSVLSEAQDGRDSPDQIVPGNRQLFAYPSSIKSKKSGLASTISGSDSVIATPSLDGPLLQFQSRSAALGTDGKQQSTTTLPKPAGPKAAPLIVKPKVALVKFAGTVIPLNNSIARQLNGKCLSDMALLFGRRFKVGWGSQNSLFMLSTADNCQDLQPEYNLEDFTHIFKGRAIDDCSRSVIQNLKINSTKCLPHFVDSIENHLNVQLRLGEKVAVADTDCPQWKASGGTAIIAEHLDLAKINARLGEIEEYVVSVWSLCQALWGDQEDLEGQDGQSHVTIIRRKELLSEWLEEESMREKGFLKSNNSDYLSHLLNLLACHKVADACELSFSNGDMNLALLMAQLSGGPAIRQLIQHQLSSWQDVEADKFIRVERLKAFMLLAGIPLLSSAHGVINIFEDLDWIKAFAANLWYITSATASITDALNAYDQAHQAAEFHAMSPQPPYVNEYDIQRKEPVQDLRYHILKLYSKRSHPMESLLNPATHSSDQMDFRLSWLLLQVFESIGYHHCSELSASQLHVSFASQLENYDLWHWAIFVLLHIENREQRELCVQTILYKYITLSLDDDYVERELFVVNELGIPDKWIYWAKAVRAGAMSKHNSQADYLLKAKQWAHAHEVIMSHLAPDAIINDNIQYLRDLLERFDDHRKVPNWSNQGMILLDYIEISEKFESLKTIHQSDIEIRWESLKPQLSELCSRINLFPCPTAKHRLCQSEIAQRLANLVCGMKIMCPELNSFGLMKTMLEKLPLPQEYAQQKLRDLLEDSALMQQLMQE